MITNTKPQDPRYELDQSRPVEVYRNLHKKCYSIKQDGLVKGHANRVTLKECTFHVNETGRDRVRRTRRKEVHAWVKGFVAPDVQGGILPEYSRIHYNPYKTNTFVHRVETGPMSATLCEIVRADCVSLLPYGIFKR